VQKLVSKQKHQKVHTESLETMFRKKKKKDYDSALLEARRVWGEAALIKQDDPATELARRLREHRSFNELTDTKFTNEHGAEINILGGKAAHPSSYGRNSLRRPFDWSTDVPYEDFDDYGPDGGKGA